MLANYGFDIDYIVIILSGIALLFLILIIMLFISLSRLKKKYKQFMQGSNAESLENKFIEDFKNIDGIMEENKVIKMALKKLSESQKLSYSKMGIVQYDAFDDTTGKLSFIIALLNDGNDGVVLNSVYSVRGGCYLYSKEIISGESYKVLTEEEKLALKSAIEGEHVKL